MRLTENVYMVGGGTGGFGLSHRNDANVYVVTDGSSAVLVDAGLGPGTDQIIENIRRDGLDPQTIERVLVTHAHADHAGGCAALKRALGLRVFVPRGAKRWLEEADADAIDLNRAKRAGGYYPEYELEPVGVDGELGDGDAIQVGELELRTVRTPGHSATHNCYTFKQAGRVHLFSGDFVFWQGRISLLYTSDASVYDYGQSMEKFRGAGIDALFPGHGAFTISGGQEHIDKALAAFDRLGVPPNFGA